MCHCRDTVRRELSGTFKLKLPQVAAAIGDRDDPSVGEIAAPCDVELEEVRGELSQGMEGAVGRHRVADVDAP